MQSNVIAAIDLGSNSFHMIVARHESGHLIIVDQLREMVRLAAGLGSDNRLTADAMNKALACLSRFAQRIEPLHADVIRAVGTNTLRKARNSAEFLDRAEEILGQPVEIISGIEEARLIYLGVAHSVEASNGRRLVVDIGGGSTEMIVGERFNPIHMESLYMGCVSMSQGFFPDGQIRPERIKQAEKFAWRELEPHLQTYHRQQWQDCIGASGTIKAIHRIALEQGWSEFGITRKALQKIYDETLKATSFDGIGLPGLKEDRRPVFVGGLVILKVVFEALDIGEMTVSDGALREGLLYDLLGRELNEQTRNDAVENFAQKYGFDRRHAGRVETTAVELLQQVPDSWFNSERDLAEPFLRWSARLHEIGLSIAHNQYHKHGEYMVRNADLLGFSRQDQQLLASLVRGHRRSFPRDSFKSLPKSWRNITTRLCILLRLSVILNRSRSDSGYCLPQMRIEKKEIRLQFPEGWLASHPLTQNDLEEEQQVLAKNDYQLSFQ